MDQSAALLDKMKKSVMQANMKNRSPPPCAATGTKCSVIDVSARLRSVCHPGVLQKKLAEMTRKRNELAKRELAATIAASSSGEQGENNFKKKEEEEDGSPVADAAATRADDANVGAEHKQAAGKEGGQIDELDSFSTLELQSFTTGAFLLHARREHRLASEGIYETKVQREAHNNAASAVATAAVVANANAVGSNNNNDAAASPTVAAAAAAAAAAADPCSVPCCLVLFNVDSTTNRSFICTPLLVAIACGHIHYVQAYVAEYGVRGLVSHRTNDGRGAVEFALRGGHVDMLDYLIKITRTAQQQQQHENQKREKEEHAGETTTTTTTTTDEQQATTDGSAPLTSNEITAAAAAAMTKEKEEEEDAALMDLLMAPNQMGIPPTFIGCQDGHLAIQECFRYLVLEARVFDPQKSVCVKLPDAIDDRGPHATHDVSCLVLAVRSASLAVAKMLVRQCGCRFPVDPTDKLHDLALFFLVASSLPSDTNKFNLDPNSQPSLGALEMFEFLIDEANLYVQPTPNRLRFYHFLRENNSNNNNNNNNRKTPFRVLERLPTALWLAFNSMTSEEMLLRILKKLVAQQNKLKEQVAAVAGTAAAASPTSSFSMLKQISEQCHLRQQSNNGSTLTHVACARDFRELYRYLEENKALILRELGTAGTPLIAATMSSNYELVKAILRSGQVHPGAPTAGSEDMPAHCIHLQTAKSNAQHLARIATLLAFFKHGFTLENDRKSLRIFSVASVCVAQQLACYDFAAPSLRLPYRTAADWPRIPPFAYTSVFAARYATAEIDTWRLLDTVFCAEPECDEPSHFYLSADTQPEGGEDGGEIGEALNPMMLKSASQMWWRTSPVSRYNALAPSWTASGLLEYAVNSLTRLIVRVVNRRWGVMSDPGRWEYLYEFFMSTCTDERGDRLAAAHNK